MTCTDVIINLAIGITGSVLASVIVLYYTKQRERKQIEKKYGAPVGSYFGYGYKEQGHNIIMAEAPLSEVEISYDKDNKLKLVLKEISHDSEWSGIVAMENDHYGTVSWKYDKLHGIKADLKTHRFGFKRLLFLMRENRKIVYLVGEEGYGKEILIEKPQISS